MEYNDFRQKLIDLKGKRVRIAFQLPEISTRSYYTGKILQIDEDTKSLAFEPDTKTHGPLEDDDMPMDKTWFNLGEGGIVIYAVDEIPEDAILKSEAEKQEHIGIRTEYIPYDKEGNPLREPQEGYVILHKDHIYAKGTVYTQLPEREAGET